MLPRWRQILADGVQSTEELLGLLGLDPETVAGPAGAVAAAGGQFPVRVPRGFVARMTPGDPRDPLLLQVLPTARETEPVPGFTPDPLREAGVSPVPGLLHKYRGRVLVMVTGACAVHCRYCFRRHFPYGDHALTGEAVERVAAYVAADPSVTEVILSGGDPLSLPDDKLAALVERLAGAPHLRRLRVHTRLPVVLPERVDDALVAWLEASAGRGLAPVVVLHANHPREVSAAVAAAVARLRRAGVTVLNQSVLLAGVNDHPDTLAELSETLFAAGVVPYYLHLLDPVAGAAHFEVGEERAVEVVRALSARLSGYLVPRLVREEPGAAGKVPRDLHLSADPAAGTAGEVAKATRERDIVRSP
jgi:L-lysine 2,3-aminomutase